MLKQNAQQFRSAVAEPPKIPILEFHVHYEVSTESGFDRFMLSDPCNATRLVEPTQRGDLETRNSELETLSLTTSNSFAPLRRAFAAGTPNSFSM